MDRCDGNCIWSYAFFGFCSDKDFLRQIAKVSRGVTTTRCTGKKILFTDMCKLIGVDLVTV